MIFRVGPIFVFVFHRVWERIQGKKKRDTQNKKIIKHRKYTHKKTDRPHGT